jgi:polysaccharide export outer membrane protein
VSIDELVDVYPITPLLIQRMQKPMVVGHRKSKFITVYASSYQYRVQAGDVLAVVVWDHPELMMPLNPNANTTVTKESPRGGVPVNADGTIYYPYVGTVKVAGKTQA